MTRKVAGFGFAFAMAELAAVCLPPLALLPTAAFVILALVVLCLRAHTWHRFGPVLVGVLIGLVWTMIFRSAVVEPITDLAGQTVTAQAVVLTDAEASYEDGSLRGTLRFVEINGKSCSIKVSCNAFPAVEPGDRFTASFSLQSISSDRYRLSNYADGVYLEAEYTGGYTALDSAKTGEFALYRLRKQLSHLLCVWMPNDLGGIEAAMLLGDKSRLTQTVEDDFRAAGVSHMLAISGLHLSVLCGLFSVGGQRWRFFRPYLALQGLLTVFYMILSGLSVSVLRAGVIYLITLLGYALLQPPDLLTSLGLAAILIGLPNAYAPCDIGFQLSFCGVLGVQLSGALGRWQKQKILPENDRPPKTFRRKAAAILLSVLETFETAAMASLATLPVLLLHGLSVSGASVPANLLTVWMLRPALVLGLAVLLAAAFPWLGPLHHLLSMVLSVWLSWMYALIRWCAALPFARLYMPRRYVVFVWCVLAGLALVFWARHRLKWYLPAAAVCLFLAMVMGTCMENGVLHVYMVGTAGNACTVLVQDRHAVVLFRGGAGNLYAVRECLSRNGISKWDAVFDLRQEPDALDFSSAATVVTLAQMKQPVLTTALTDEITAECFCSDDGTMCVIQVGRYRIAAATGQPEPASTIQVDLFCAASSLPSCIQADVVMTNTLSPRWMAEWEGSLLYAGEEPAAVIRPGKSVVFEEGKVLAVQ